MPEANKDLTIEDVIYGMKSEDKRGLLTQWKDYFKTVTDRSKKVEYPEVFNDLIGKATLAPLSLTSLYTKDIIDYGKIVAEQMYTKEKDPVKTTMIALGLLGGGAPFAPKGSAVLGTIKKVGPVKRKEIRNLVKQEFKARGPAKAPQDLSNLDTEDLIDYIARGQWYHGRKTYPKAGETFGSARVAESNLGEPYGLSLTADPNVFLSGHFAKTPVKLERVYQALLQKKQELKKALFETPLDPALQENFDTLAKARVAIAEQFKANLITETEFNKKMAASFSLASRLKDRSDMALPEFKQLTKIENKLEELGFVGEVDSASGLTTTAGKTQFARVLPKFEGDPKSKVLPAWKSKETQWSQDILKETYVEALRRQPGVFSQGTSSSKLLSDWKNLINKNQLNKDMSDILQEKGYKALLYSPARFSEFELRMLNPKDVVRMDMRHWDDPGIERLQRYNLREESSAREQIRQAKRLDTWRAKTEGFEASLRDIYKDIDLTDLPFKPVVTPEAMAEKLGLKYQGKWPDADLWEFMDLETKGNLTVSNLDDLEMKVLKLKESMKGTKNEF